MLSKVKGDVAKKSNAGIRDRQHKNIIFIRLQFNIGDSWNLNHGSAKVVCQKDIVNLHMGNK